MSSHPRTVAAGAAVPPHPAVATTGSRQWLWRRWFGLVTLGELLGFGVPAVVGALVADRAGAVAAVALLSAGAVEGAVLGWFQARALRPLLPALRGRNWIVATVVGALVAWSVGALLVLTDGLRGWAPTLTATTMLLGGVVILLSIGTAQWFVLRDLVDRAARWIAATAAAWLAGLAAFTAFTTPLWQPGQPVALIALIGGGGGLVMAAAMAAVSGAFLVRLTARSDGSAATRSPVSGSTTSTACARNSAERSTTSRWSR